jgi:hypothetical protein
MTKLTYTNPRLNAVVPNWPHGSKRVTATFSVESNPKHGERAVRVTTGAPKKRTYADQVRIVDGSDGLTYIAEYNKNLPCMFIAGGNMLDHEEIIYKWDPRWADLLALFETEEVHS